MARLTTRVSGVFQSVLSSHFSTTPSVRRAGARWSFRLASPLSVSECHSRSLSYDSTLRPESTLLSSASKAEIQLDPPRIKLSRLTEMEDSQMFGLIHGCSQLQLVEDAGTTLTTKYCNHFATARSNCSKLFNVKSFILINADDILSDGCIAVVREKPGVQVRTLSACLERAEFLKPMLVGDIAEVEAEITYTTARSLQVTASVYAKSQSDGSRYKTIEAKTWFVAKSDDEDNPVSVDVPPLRNTDGSLVQRPESEAGYQAIMEHRKRIRPDLFDRPYRPTVIDYYAPAESIEPCTVDFSRHSFSLPVHPNHCVPGENYCRGGVILRLMDECAAVIACVHNSHYSFTSSMDSILFHRKVQGGTMLVAYCKAIFTSSKTLETAVRVEQLRLSPDGRGNNTARVARVADGILTFMMVDNETGKTRPVPPLKLITDEDKSIFESRKKIYEHRKLARMTTSS